MTPALAGQIVTATISVCLIVWLLTEIAIDAVEERSRAKIAKLEALNGKIDRFTGEYGARSEDPDDQPYEESA